MRHSIPVFARDGLPVWLYWIVLAIAAFCVAFMGLRAFNTIQDFDGAYIATVAKNLADGEGYLTTYQPIQGYVDRNREDPSRLFNAEITTGPGMILPGAAVFAILGNHPWTASIAALVINLTIFITIFAYVRISLLKEHEENWRSFCVLAVLLLIAGTATIMHPGNLASVFRHWFEFIGEITASGYVVLGAVVAALGRGRLQSALGAGVLFGLAAQTKSLAVLQILVIAPLLVWHFAASLRSLKPTAMASAALAFGYAIPNVTVALWISASLSPTDYAEQLDATARLFGEAGSGLTQLRQADDPVAYIIGNIAAHAKAFATVFSPLDSVLALVLIGVCLTVVFGEARASRLGRARPFDPWLVAGGALVLAACAQVTWWFLLEYGPWIRRLTQAVTILAIAVALVLMIAPGRRLRLIGLACAIGLAAPTLWRVGEAFVKLRGQDPQFAAAIELSRILEEKQRAGFESLGCGFDGLRELELMRDGQYNFVDCLNLPPRAWGKPAILVQGPYFQLLAANEQGAQRVVQACDPPFYTREPYVARTCSAKALEPNYIRVGLYENGDGGFWTERLAILPIIDLGPPRTAVLRIYSPMPDIEKKPLQGVVTLSQAGTEVWRSPIDLRRTSRLQDLIIPRDAFAKADRMRIEVDRDFNPKALGLGPDDRDLAVLISFDPERAWRGFYEDTTSGRWMSGEGQLNVTAQMRRNPPRLSFFAANPDLSRDPLIVRIAYIADDQVVGRRDIRLTSEKPLQEILLSAELLAKADHLDLTTSRTFVPAKVGSSGDTRTLGVIVRLLP
jgi:hypothetical protein